MNYIVNEKLKKEINKEILDKRKPEFKVRYYIYKVLFVVPSLIFIIPFVLTLPVIVANVKEGYIADAFGFMIIWLLAFGFYCSHDFFNYSCSHQIQNT